MSIPRPSLRRAYQLAPRSRLFTTTAPLSASATATATATAPSDLDFEAARQWHSQRGEKPIVAEIGEVSYARSSGPGGQNVNKVNSKAQLRVFLHQLLPMVPPVLHDALRKSRYVAEKTSSILIQCDESRRQQVNKDICYRRLNELVMDVYHSVVPGETSEQQQKKVKALQHAENEARLRQKKLQSSKKAARGKGRGDD